MITKFYVDYVEANTAFSFGTEMFIGRDPDSPDQIIRFSNETGFREDWQNEYGSDWLGLMIRVRGYMPWAETTMFTIHNLITNYGRVSNDDFYLITTNCIGEPSQIEVDSSGRVILTAHYMAHVNWKDKTTNRMNLEPTIAT